MDVNIRELFSQDSRSAFDQGAAAQLVARRNSHLGNLLDAERGVYYVQILYALLRFRRAHELEPLHDDLYAAVQRAQEAICDEGEYSPDRFREDVNALLDWTLVDQRIELERLRGYRDTRRRKFRYSLSEETISFLEWLEERLQDDLEERGADTRDLLESVCGALRELHRVLYRVDTKRAEDGDARRALFQLGRLDQLTHAIGDDLTALNARMYGFVMRRYDIAEARHILRELETFVDAFLRQIYTLRGEIVEMLGTLHGEGPLAKIRACVEQMENERRQASHLIRGMHDPASLTAVPSALTGFYQEAGGLDALCRRISATATTVWRKLHLHLRELERKSHRLDDLRTRIDEIAALPPDVVPVEFLFSLIAPASMSTDPQRWCENEKADPPEPRRKTVRQDDRVRSPLTPKSRHGGEVRTLEQKRLAVLRDWLRANVITPGEASALLADGRFETLDDLVRVMDLAKAGVLGRGRKLESIGYRIEQDGCRDLLTADEYTLSLPALRVLNGGRDGR